MLEGPRMGDSEARRVLVTGVADDVKLTPY